MSAGPGGGFDEAYSSVAVVDAANTDVGSRSVDVLTVVGVRGVAWVVICKVCVQTVVLVAGAREVVGEATAASEVDVLLTQPPSASILLRNPGLREMHHT